jgi:hypothetical protein
MIYELRPVEFLWKCSVLLRDREGRVLIYKRGGLWDIFSDEVKYSESPIDAVTRLVRDLLDVSLYDIKLLFTNNVGDSVDFVFECFNVGDNYSIREGNFEEFKWEYFWYLCNYDNLEDSFRYLVNLYNSKFGN